MIKIAISGNIAAGKSEVEKILISKGYKVLDTDKVCHELISSNTAIIEKIIHTFGISATDENHQISRKKLGEIVFSDFSKKKELENILHPEIREQIKKFLAENHSETFLFISVPLLFEVNMDKDFDKIIFVSSKENIRLKRLMQRNNLSKEQAKSRIDAQQKEQNKIEHSDFVIENNSDFNNLETQISNILKELSTLNGLL